MNLCTGEDINYMQRGSKCEERKKKDRRKRAIPATFHDLFTFLPEVLSSSSAAVNHDVLIPNTY